MKLYVYDHCPYCVRARMPFAIKGVPFTVAILDNDDEATPKRLVGRKVLPILEDADGAMAESLDIVRKVDALDGRPIFGGEASPALTAWLTEWGATIRTLVVPRTPNPAFPEFHTQAARDYFTAQKEGLFGPFTDLLAQGDSLKGDMARGLHALVPHLPNPERPGIDDILLFPFLRSLYLVPGLAMPPAVQAYCERMAQRCDVALVRAA